LVLVAVEDPIKQHKQLAVVVTALTGRAVVVGLVVTMAMQVDVVVMVAVVFVLYFR
jgi:hypothetical protein